MKKIIRQILDDLSVQRSTDVARRDTPSEEIHNDAPKIYEPTTGPELPVTENQGEIQLSDNARIAAKPEDLNFDSKPEPVLPGDLNNQDLSKNPEERLRQLDFQAQKDKERIG